MKIYSVLTSIHKGIFIYKVYEKMIYKIKQIRAYIYFAITGLKFGLVGSGCKLKINSNNAVIGKNVNIGDFCWFETVEKYNDCIYKPRLIIGENCNFSDSVHISCVKKITIGAGCLFGSRIYIGDNSHGSYSQNKDIFEEINISPGTRNLGNIHEIKIGKNCWIGDGVVIMSGVCIGDGVVIGANSIIKDDVAPYTMVAGIPAVPKKMYDKQNKCWVSCKLPK